MVLLIVLIIILPITTRVDTEEVSPRNWFTSYPQGGSSIGPFLAISWPIEIAEGQEMLFSYYFEANFALPTNVTQYYDNYTGDSSKTLYITRGQVYELLENRLTREGFNGPVCLLKFICEISSIPLLNSGLLSQLLHVLLAPSTSEAEQGLSQYVEAEQAGSGGVDCDRAYSDCDTEINEVLPFWIE